VNILPGAGWPGIDRTHPVESYNHEDPDQDEDPDDTSGRQPSVAGRMKMSELIQTGHVISLPEDTGYLFSGFGLIAGMLVPGCV
jgi:hypothetical protein